MGIALDPQAISVILKGIVQPYLSTSISLLQHHHFSNKPNDMSKGHHPQRRSLFLPL